MQMVRKSPYIKAAIAALIIFMLGFLIGFTILNQQLEGIRADIDKNQLNLWNLQLEMLFLDTLDEKAFCPYMNERLDQITSETAEIGNKLVNPEGLSKESFDILKRRYSIALIQSWLFSKNYNDRCEAKKVNVLYFYELYCDSCINQGYVLDYMVEKTNDLSIFSLDRNLDEPVIQLLVKNFDINVAPTLVINGEKYEGFRDKEELTEIFCGINKELPIC